MVNSADAFKINLNQNLWGLFLSFGFLGIAEYYELHALFWLALVPSVAMVISLCITTWAYTDNYVRNKAS